MPWSSVRRAVDSSADTRSTTSSSRPSVAMLGLPFLSISQFGSSKPMPKNPSSFSLSISSLRHQPFQSIDIVVGKMSGKGAKGLITTGKSIKDKDKDKDKKKPISRCSGAGLQIPTNVVVSLPAMPELEMSDLNALI